MTVSQPAEIVHLVAMDMVTKIEHLLRGREKRITQGGLEAQAALSANRISKWKAGKGEPTARQALRIARLLKVPLEWLVDDAVSGPPEIERELTKSEWSILAVVRALELDADEAIRRLAGEPGGRTHQGGTLPTIAVRDESAAGRRDEAEMRKRLGVELEADRQRPGPNDIPPVRRK